MLRGIREAIEKTNKASKTWAQLILRIYEIDPLIFGCGNKLKIITFVTQSEYIIRIFSGVGRPADILAFDRPHDLALYDMCI